MMTIADKPKRRWFQFSLRTLLILVTVFAIACSWYAVEMQKAAKRRTAIKEIKRLGGDVRYYDASNPNTLGDQPKWHSLLRKLHGDEHLGNPVAVSLEGTQITDAGLDRLEGFRSLERLSLHGTQITDAGLVHIQTLDNLDFLNLGNTDITDAGLAYVKDLKKLELLWLDETTITDAGLVNLQGLRSLTLLVLDNTQITEQGVERLKETLPISTAISHEGAD